MKRILIIAGILLIVVVGLVFLRSKNGADAKTSIEYTEVTRGDLENVISSTGTIEPISTVEIGTQVSGTIDKIFVDFNDMVQKNQVLAVLDTTFLAASVRDARAGIVRAQAQYDKSVKEFDRNTELFKKNYISEFELMTYETTMKTNFASLQSAQTALERAEFNLNYAVIRSPIAGKVIYRSIEEGQTVAASFSTPTLFLIAEDLSKMEIHALVDESDIGQIKEGQQVRFSVEAYYDNIFTGTVREVWLQPETISNVVTYTVIVDAQNNEGLLLPGMTATIDFIIEKKENVLLVPNTALRVQPTDEMLKEIHPNPTNRSNDSTGYEKNTGLADFEKTRGKNYRDNITRLWTEDNGGKYKMYPVQTGLTDGKMTEVFGNDQIVENMKIITNTGQKVNNNAADQRMDMRMMGRMLRG
ncbi:MAG: efflux RND transporter periplasmic adaptor subunit [Candidatus Latescibacteria bacterium]|nr:efflux RND transporter periplasmic adaptor subunit [Candidatus Latescibacterota bacterium]